MKDVLLATSVDLPDGDEDAKALVAALTERDVRARWAVWTDPDVDWTAALVVLRSTWDYTGRRGDFLDWAAQIPRLANPAEVIVWNTDKSYLADLAAAGVPIVPSSFAAPGESVELPDTGEIVVKPSVGAGSRGAGRFGPGRRGAAREHAAALQALGRTVLVQPYLDGVDTDGETALIYVDGGFSHAVRKAPLLGVDTTHGVDGDALFVPEQMSAREADDAQLAVGELALEAVRTRFTADLLYCRVDLLPTPDGPVVIELELVEPSLFLGYGEQPVDRQPVDRFADAIRRARMSASAQVDAVDGTAGAPPIPFVAVERLRALRRMKAVAGGLLLVAAAIFVVCRTVGDGNGVWGYLEAAAEASMVGGLADWFAVTALFRHPLRIPIPHTAIIPSKKDQIGEGLAGFVRQYFLTTEIVNERVAAAHVPQRLGEWLADPAHARRLGDEFSIALGGLANVLRDDELRDAVAGFADKRLRDTDVAPILARVLDAACDAGQHQATLTTVLRGTRKFLDGNRSAFRRRVASESPEWVPDWVDERVFNKGFALLQTFLADVIDDDEHELRKGFDTQLRELTVRLRDDPEQRAKVEAAKLQVLDHPSVREYLANLWGTVKQLVLDGAANPESDLRGWLESLAVRTGEVLRDDPEVGAKVDEALQRLTGHVVANYADDLTAVISTTVARWDTEETSRRLELQVGRDLQFIRINGTVVGALAGVVIYAISRLF